MKPLKVDEAVGEDTSCLILYGSQLGNAQAIAESLQDTAEAEYFLNPRLLTLNELSDIAEFGKIRVPVVIVTSTTGDGDAPENADKFLRKLRRKVLKPGVLAGVRYTILGLGDTNFNNFCNCGKLVHKRLQELGATLFFDPGWADDAVGLEEVVEPWTEELWPSLQTAIEDTENRNPTPDKGKESKSRSRSPVKKLFKRMLSPKDKGKDKKEPSLPSSSTAENGEASGVPVTLTLPACPKSSVTLEFKDQPPASPPDLLNPPAPYPQNDGGPYTGFVSSGRLLTSAQSVKTTVELTIRFEEPNFDFEPGDAIGIVCPNPTEEVERLIDHLELQEVADQTCVFSLKAEAKGKIPAHIPKEGASIRQILIWYLDIRTPPKKTLLRLLAESCSDTGEKSTLLECCSKQGAAEYEKHVRQPSTSLLDIFLKFRTCKPPIAALLEHLPRLIPRSYSISSSPLSSATSFTIAFNIIEFKAQDKDCDTEYRSYERLGVCTGWLTALWQRHFTLEADTEKLINKFKYITTNPDAAGAGDAPPQPRIAFYKRKNHNFRLPKSLDAPVMMVGPGTGVAPFIGFIQHRTLQSTAADAKIGPMVLYFGCRYEKHDFLYSDELEKFKNEGQLSELHTSFSRDLPAEGVTHYKYVQDMMWRNREELAHKLLEDGAYLYVCGDAKNMAKNVREKLIACFQDVKGLSESEAMAKVANLVVTKKYLQDVWI